MGGRGSEGRDLKQMEQGLTALTGKLTLDVRDLITEAPEARRLGVMRAPTSDERVVLHPATLVREFLGRGRLEGVRLEAADGKGRTDLAVEGAFLEIGLVANSGPGKGLVALNAQGEVEVGRDQSPSVPGLFAAGGVTGEPEKQIVVAAGAGAKAALAAARYLADRSAPSRRRVALAPSGRRAASPDGSRRLAP